MREYQLSIVFMLKTDKAYIFHFQNKPNKFNYTYIYLYKYPINFRSLINIEKKPLLFLVLSCFLVFVRSFLSSLSPLSLSLSLSNFLYIYLSIYRYLNLIFFVLFRYVHNLWFVLNFDSHLNIWIFHRSIQIHRNSSFKEDDVTWKGNEDGKIINNQPTRVMDDRNGVAQQAGYIVR